MHPSPLFRNDDIDFLIQYARDVGFGAIFCQTPDGPRVAHVPFVATDAGVLRFHLARGNAVCHFLDGATALAVVNGPDGYVSPDWYELPDQVPTWDYVAVEMEGRCTRLGDEELIQLMDDISAINEARLHPKPAWTRAKMDPKRFAQMVRGVYGFELQVTEWRSTFKLSQDKPADVRARVVAKLEEQNSPVLAAAVREAQ